MTPEQAKAVSAVQQEIEAVYENLLAVKGVVFANCCYAIARVVVLEQQMCAAMNAAGNREADVVLHYLCSSILLNLHAMIGEDQVEEAKNAVTSMLNLGRIA